MYKLTPVLGLLSALFCLAPTHGYANSPIEGVFLPTAKKKAINKAFEKVGRARQGGFIALGSVELSDGADPSRVGFQDEIHPDGFFVTTIADLSKPLCFFREGYRSVRLDLSDFRDQERGKPLELGRVRMEKLAPSELVRVQGSLKLPQGQSASGLRISFTGAESCLNTVDGTSREGKTAVEQRQRVIEVNPDGTFESAPLSPGSYTFFSLPSRGEEPAIYFRQTVEVSRGPKTVLAPFETERAARFVLRYKTAKRLPFPGKKAYQQNLTSGTHWNPPGTRPGEELEFRQKNGAVELVASGLSGEGVAEVGEGPIQRFRWVEPSKLEFKPAMALKPGHSYLYQVSRAKGKSQLILLEPVGL